jgi:Outer membrane protein beta-barrel domain
MTRSGRVLTLAATLNAILACTAHAQTVIVRRAPPGSTIELVVNTETVGSTTADASGDARLTTNMFAAPGKSETDAFLFVDFCTDNRRIVIVERSGQPAQPPAGCDRRQILGVYLVRKISTLVVNAAGPNPTVLLRQGSVSLRPSRVWTPSPAGLHVFGGGGLMQIRDAVGLACGNVSNCSGDDSAIGYTVGATYWFSRYLAAEGSFTKPAEVTIEGSGDDFRFTSFQDSEIYAMSGKVGFPTRRLRFYGQAGANYHRSTSGTSETLDDITVTNDDGTETVIEGGVQTFNLKTSGWSWQFGGGAEFWILPRVAAYGEVGWTWIKGEAEDDGDGATDDRYRSFVGGIRLRLWP